MIEWFGWLVYAVDCGPKYITVVEASDAMSKGLSSLLLTLDIGNYKYLMWELPSSNTLPRPIHCYPAQPSPAQPSPATIWRLEAVSTNYVPVIRQETAGYMHQPVWQSFWPHNIWDMTWKGSNWPEITNQMRNYRLFCQFSNEFQNPEPNDQKLETMVVSVVEFLH